MKHWMLIGGIILLSVAEKVHAGTLDDWRDSLQIGRALKAGQSSKSSMNSSVRGYAAVLRDRRRRKRGLVWSTVEDTLHETYERDLELIRNRHPELSPMERRVCVLAKAMIPNWKVGELLGISEKTVENHLRNARRRLNLPPGTRMYNYLASLGTGTVAKPQAARAKTYQHTIA